MEVAVKALPRHRAQDSAPSRGTRALALRKKKKEKRNIPLTSVHLCDSPSVPGSFPLSCSPPLQILHRPLPGPTWHRGTLAGLGGCWGHPRRGATRVGDPLRCLDTPTPPHIHLPRAGEERAPGCCRKLPRFHRPVGRNARGAPPRVGSGATGRCLGGGGWDDAVAAGTPSSTRHTSVTMQRRPLKAVPGEKPCPGGGFLPSPYPAEVRGEGQQIRGVPSRGFAVCWGGGQ